MNFEGSETIAKVINVENLAKRKKNENLSWSPIKSNQDLYKGDYLFTDEKSSIDIKFINNSQLEIPPNTLVKIDINDNIFELDLKQGLLDLNLSGSNNKVNIITNGEKITLKGSNSQVKIQSTKSGLNIWNQGGNLQLNSEGKNISLDSTEAFNSSIGKKLNPDKIIRFTFPGNDYSQVINKNPKLNFMWESNSNSLVTLKVSRSANFDKRVQRFKSSDKVTKNKHVIFSRPGSYYAQLTTNTDDGLVSSRIIKIRMEPPEPLNLLSPSTDEVINIIKGLALKLETDGSPLLNHDIIIEGPHNQKTTDLFQSNQYFFTPKNSGNYKIKLKSSLRGSPWSKDHLLKIKLSEGTTLLSPDPNQIHMRNNKHITIDLKWKSERFKKFKLEVSNKKDFSKIFLTKKLNGNEYGLKFKKNGVFYWRVSPQSNPDLTSSSQFTIDSPVAINTVPNNKQIIRSAKDITPIDFKWRKLKHEGEKFTIKVSSDPGLKNIIIKKQTSKKSITLNLDRKGTFYWSVFANKDEHSVITKFQLTLPKISPAPAINPRQIIHYKKIKGHDTNIINMPKIKYAKRYHIEVYQDKKMKKRLFHKDFKNNYGYWVSNRSGKFFYRVKVVDRWGRETEWSKLGVLIFPISPLVF